MPLQEQVAKVQVHSLCIDVSKGSNQLQVQSIYLPMHLQENLRYRQSKQLSRITGRSNTQRRNKSDLMLQQGEQSCVNSLTYTRRKRRRNKIIGAFRIQLPCKGH